MIDFRNVASSAGQTVSTTPQLQLLAGRLHDLRSRIANHSSILEQTCDTLGIPSQPVDMAPKMAIGDNPVGLLAQLQGAVDDLYPAIARLEREVERIATVAQ